MTLRLDVSTTAKRDMSALIAYIGQDNPKAAIQVAELIVEKMRLLVDHPWIGRPGRREKSRELVVDGTPYIVAYRVETDQRRIFVLRIIHHAQRWPEKF